MSESELDQWMFRRQYQVGGSEYRVWASGKHSNFGRELRENERFFGSTEMLFLCLSFDNLRVKKLRQARKVCSALSLLQCICKYYSETSQLFKPFIINTPRKIFPVGTLLRSWKTCFYRGGYQDKPGNWAIYFLQQLHRNGAPETMPDYNRVFINAAPVKNMLNLFCFLRLVCVRQIRHLH